MIVVYNAVLCIYHLGIRIYAVFNDKASRWVKGRKGLLKQIASEVKQNENIVWVHCASLGEFEQGRPIFEKLKEQDASLKVLITFFSPSGYEVRKNYSGAEYVYYLPPDSRRSAAKFLDIVNPKMAIFVKYEYWHHYLSALSFRSIPSYLVSARFHKKQVFFKAYGGFFRKTLKNHSKIFVQNDKSIELLKSIGIESGVYAGDTRFDRVMESKIKRTEVEGISVFKGENKLLVAGSTWLDDERRIIPYINECNDQVKIIIAPHEIDKGHIRKIQSMLKVKNILYSEIGDVDIQGAKVLIIDNIGLLSAIYQYGDIAYVGGAFKGALHNILEPATFGMPIVIGPEFEKFHEAIELIELGGAFAISDADTFKKRMSFFFSEPFVIKIASEICKTYIKQNAGATEIIIRNLAC